MNYDIPRKRRDEIFERYRSGIPIAYYNRIFGVDQATYETATLAGRLNEFPTIINAQGATAEVSWWALNRLYEGKSTHILFQIR